MHPEEVADEAINTNVRHYQTKGTIVTMTRHVTINHPIYAYGNILGTFSTEKRRCVGFTRTMPSS